MSLLPASRGKDVEGCEELAVFKSLPKVLEQTLELFEFKYSLECFMASQTEHDQRILGGGTGGKLERKSRTQYSRNQDVRYFCGDGYL